MFDRTIPMISLAMQTGSLEGMPVFEIPEGYGWRYYQSGDERIWAEIEMSAGEFSDIESGINAFRRYYPDVEALKDRMFFLTDNGIPFATATAWYGDDDKSQGRLHWVSVDAPHQGKGLSKPLVSIAMHRMRDIGHKNAYLTTQTASWVAIKVYHKFGFIPCVGSDDEIRGWEIVSEKTGIDFMKYIKL